VREWRVVNAPDVRKDPRYLEMNPETRSEMIVPLFYKGRVIGVLDLEHTRTNFFNEEHERMLVTLAAQVAIAIENARLYQRVRRQEQQLERDIRRARCNCGSCRQVRPSTRTRTWQCAFCRREP
jgi:sigma-B regulation protein RsbU (phosphoserine phosphatase)